MIRRTVAAPMKNDSPPSGASAMNCALIFSSLPGMSGQNEFQSYLEWSGRKVPAKF
jgi:hypothetical protein